MALKARFGELGDIGVARRPADRAGPATRAARITGISVSRMMTETTAFTSGSCWPSRIAPKIHSGSVFCAPAVNTVTMTSLKDRAKASSAPETSAVAVSGSVT